MNNDFTRAEILDTAKRIVTGDREQQYGSPEDNFAAIAQYWTTYLGREVTAHDVAIMMAMLKIARIQSGQVKADNYVDLAGYAACAAEIAGGKQTIDPVRHARWIHYPDNNSHVVEADMCSECKNEYVFGDMYNYCPNCGAKMDGAT